MKLQQFENENSTASKILRKFVGGGTERYAIFEVLRIADRKVPRAPESFDSKMLRPGGMIQKKNTEGRQSLAGISQLCSGPNICSLATWIPGPSLEVEQQRCGRQQGHAAGVTPRSFASLTLSVERRWSRNLDDHRELLYEPRPLLSAQEFHTM